MTLTEQWKKGELSEGFYYVKDGENIIAEYIDGYFYNNGQPMTSFSGGVDEVLAPVPSYEEWQDEQISLKVLAKAYCKRKKETQQLKELLYSLKCCLTSENIEPQIRVEKSLAKITNAIGEK